MQFAAFLLVIADVYVNCAAPHSSIHLLFPSHTSMLDLKSKCCCDSLLRIKMVFSQLIKVLQQNIIPAIYSIYRFIKDLSLNGKQNNPF